MKKIVSILLAYAFLIQSIGIVLAEGKLTLSSTTRVSADAENCYARVTDTEKNSGDYSLHFYTEGDWLEIAQNYTQALTAGTYTVTWYAKGTGRVWFYSNWGTEWAATHSVDSKEVQSNGWTKYTKVLRIDGNGDTSFLFHGDGAVDQYIDDITLTDENGTNYTIDGGFEEVTVSGDEEPTPTPEPTPEATPTPEVTPTPTPEATPTPEVTPIPTPEVTPTPEPEEPSVNIPDDYLTLSDQTIVNVDNTETCFAKVTDDEKAGGNYSLHFKAGADDWLEVSQNLTAGATASGEYALVASVKAISGKVWFRVGWDDTGWLVSTQTDLGTDLGNGWYRLVKIVTLTADQTKILFHNEGAAELYIDDIMLIPVDGENLVPDGGFEDVTVYTPNPDDFEDYEISQPILKKGTEDGSYTVLANVKNNKLDNLPCELLVAVFNQEGEMENLYSTKDNFEKTALGAEADELSKTFDITGEGYYIEVYLINNRQDIELYYDPVKYDCSNIEE